MTEQEIITQVATDPLVIQAHTRFDGGAPTPPVMSFLEGVAAAELQNELNSFLNRPAVRRELLEADYSLTLSTGTDVSGSGTKFTMPVYVAQVVNITVGSNPRPLLKWRTRVEFDRWHYENVGESTTNSSSEGWVEWGRDNTGKVVILIGPGTGSDTTANVHYVRKVSQPAQLSLIPDDLHYVIAIGVKNRASGGKHQFSYNTEVSNAVDRLDTMIGGASKMPLPAVQRNANWRMSQEMASGAGTSDSPLFISRVG